MAVCDELIDVDILAEVVSNNEAEDGASSDEEKDTVMQVIPFLSHWLTDLTQKSG